MFRWFLDPGVSQGVLGPRVPGIGYLDLGRLVLWLMVLFLGPGFPGSAVLGPRVPAFVDLEEE